MKETEIDACDLILNGCSKIGSRLLEAGAEIYRVEDTVRRILTAYGVRGDVSALPVSLLVTLTDTEGRNRTRLSRPKGPAETCIEAVERYNALSRAICAAPPPPERLEKMIEETEARCRVYTGRTVLFGYFTGAFFFTLFFGGGWAEAMAAGAAGLSAGLCLRELNHIRANFFYETVLAAAVLGMTVYGLCALGMPVNAEIAMTGALMVLVPGLIFTNFMCNLITGDTLSGFIAVIRAMLTAAAMAIGAGIASSICRTLGMTGAGTDFSAEYGPWSQCVIAFLACFGFSLLYSAHGWGVALCCMGGALGWAVCLAVQNAADNIYTGYLAAAVVIASYAEIMARLRKYPAMAYLTVSYFPLVPGARIYGTMNSGFNGQWLSALQQGMEAVGIAACLAMGTLLVTSTIRTASEWRRREAP